MAMKLRLIQSTVNSKHLIPQWIYRIDTNEMDVSVSSDENMDFSDSSDEDNTRNDDWDDGPNCNQLFVDDVSEIVIDNGDNSMIWLATTTMKGKTQIFIHFLIRKFALKYTIKQN